MFRAAMIATLLLASRPGATEDWPRVQIANLAGGQLVRRALSGASRRLATPSCARVFEEFQDERGRPLHARLLELDLGQTGYLPLVVFADGSSTRQCETGSTIAHTNRGSRVVYVCARRFERAWHKNRVGAEAVLIHEALHTLGLGENPPTSAEITRRVLDYCSS